MKRFHVHLHVSDLAASLAFYSKLFAAEPARVEADYAKWMLTDPPVNFAISTRGAQPGLDHFGIQVDNADDLATLKAQAQAAVGQQPPSGTSQSAHRATIPKPAAERTKAGLPGL